MRGILTAGLPSTIEVGGVSLPINTSYRTWIDVWRVAERQDIDSTTRASIILLLVFPKPIPQEALTNVEDTIDALVAFLERRDKSMPRRPLTPAQRKLTGKRVFDWDYDSTFVVADFSREYGIDLTDPNTDMHWWRFMALFDGLRDTSQTMDAIRTRAAGLDDKDLTKAERKQLRDRKIALMLPARTPEEAALNAKLRGQGV